MSKRTELGELSRSHIVDGVMVGKYGETVLASGWQGRSFRFKHGDEGLLIQVLQVSLPVRTGEPEITHTFTVKRESGKMVTFDARCKDGWNVVRDRSRRRTLTYGENDDKAILAHLLTETGNLLSGENGMQTHYCPELALLGYYS